MEYMIYNCPLDFGTSPEKVKELNKIISEFYEYLGSYISTITSWNTTTHKQLHMRVCRVVYQSYGNHWVNDSYNKFNSCEKAADAYVVKNWGANEHGRIRDRERKKPKQVWTKQEKQREKTKQEVVKQENVIGRIFTYIHNPQYQYAQDEAMFFLDYKKGRYKVLILVYHEEGPQLIEDYKFKKEVWEMMETNQWKENDLGFLVVHGSPKQKMLAKIKEYIATYNRGIEQLEQVQEKGLADLKVEVEQKVKEEDEDTQI